MSSREERRQELERRLLALIDSLESQIDSQNLALLCDFVENFEYGVTLEWLDSLVFERAIPLLPEQSQEVEQLAMVMGLKLDESRGSQST